MNYKKTTRLAAIICVGCFLFSNIACAQQANTLTQKEKKNGWHLLFNGKNLNGWHSYLKNGVTKNWKVKNGSIVVNEDYKGQRSDLVTDKEYANFDLKFEWKMKPCSNSGVMFYVHESPKYNTPWKTGPEMQIADVSCLYTSTHSEINDDRIHLHRAGALYDLAPADTEWVKPAPKWNKYEIIARNGHLKLFVNGHQVSQTTLWNHRWKEKISKTKFRQWPDFGTFKKGHISFQGTEDGKIWFRNVKIKRLK